MNPTPVALGLFLCDRVIFDRETHCPTPVNIFTGLAVDQFPSDPQRFSVFAALSGAHGRGTMELRVVHLETDDEVFAQRYPIEFPDRLGVVNVSIRIRRLGFPAAGVYEFVIWIDGEPITRRKLRIYQTAEPNS